MSNEIIKPTHVLVVEKDELQSTQCTYSDGTQTVEITMYDDSSNSDAKTFREILVMNPSSEVLEHVWNSSRYPYSSRLANMAITQLTETGSHDMFTVLFAK